MDEKERLRLLRKSLPGYNTLDKFAKKLGISASAMSQLENGVTSITPERRTSICNAFSVNMKWLETGEGDMFTSVEDEINIFMGDILHESPSFRRAFISVLAKMDKEEWDMLEKKILELSDEMKKAALD